MPTGYTAGVGTGEIETLEQFAMLCARGMGALITMRDEPFDAPIPERFEPETGYYEKRLADARALLTEVAALSEHDCLIRSAREHDDLLARFEARKAERAAINNRYRAMLDLVDQWHTEAEGIKEFMMEQLKISIDTYREMPPVRMSAVDWKASVIADALSNISRYEKAIAEEIHRVSMRNQWLTDLRRSLEHWKLQRKERAQA